MGRGRDDLPRKVAPFRNEVRERICQVVADPRPGTLRTEWRWALSAVPQPPGAIAATRSARPHFEQQLRNGRPAPSYEQSTGTTVVLVLPGGDASPAFVRLVAQESRAGRPLGLDDLLLLNALWLVRRLSTRDAGHFVQKPEGQARAVLERLVEAGLVEAKGDRRSRVFSLSAATYRRLGDRAAYVRQRGFEPLQWEQMIRQWVEKHGSISRQEAADLCKVSAPQAYRILKQLRDPGISTPSANVDERSDMNEAARKRTRDLPECTRVFAMHARIPAGARLKLEVPRLSKWKRAGVESGVPALLAAKEGAWRAVRWSHARGAPAAAQMR